MKPKTTRTLYWLFTVLFALMMLLDGFGGVTKQQAGQDVMKHLGYPIYVLTVFGVAKLLGALAILQNRFIVIKEWAYAGFAFNFIGAFASRFFTGDPVGETLFPLVILAFMFLPYFLWKKIQDAPNNP